MPDPSSIPAGSKIQDLTGQKFGKLTFVRFIRVHYFPSGKRHPVWELICECGKNTEATANNVKSGHTTSCGCYATSIYGKFTRKHGHTAGGKETRLFRIWKGMIQRCTDANHVNYPGYGGKGVAVCEKWMKFEGFLEDMQQGYSDNLTIDRRDGGSSPYCKENCRWITQAQQNLNYSRNVRITFNGKTQTLVEWEREFGLPRSTLSGRLRIGWTPEKALTTPYLGRRDVRDAVQER